MKEAPNQGAQLAEEGKMPEEVMASVDTPPPGQEADHSRHRPDDKRVCRRDVRAVPALP